MAVRDDRSDVRQTTTGFRGPLMVQSRTASRSFIRIIFIFIFSLLCLSGCISVMGHMYCDIYPADVICDAKSETI